MTRRQEITLALAILVCCFILPGALWIAYCDWQGFSPDTCLSYGGCQEFLG